MAPPERRAARPAEVSDLAPPSPVPAVTRTEPEERPPRPPALPAYVGAVSVDPRQYAHVIPPVKEDAFQIMDNWDEEVVLRELRGESPRGKLVYKFKQQGKEVVGLGKEGVDFCCQVMMHQGQVIRELGMKYTLIGDAEQREALFVAKAGRFAVGRDGSEIKLDTVLGVKRQPLYNLIRATGEWVLNPHWYEHGAMKALRNARLRLIPIAVREEVMAMARAGGRVQSNAQEKPEDLTRKPSSDEQRSLYSKLLQSHHLTPEERVKATQWLEASRHSSASMAKQIDAVIGLVATRAEAERLAKEHPQNAK